MTVDSKETSSEDVKIDDKSNVSEYLFTPENEGFIRKCDLTNFYFAFVGAMNLIGEILEDYRRLATLQLKPTTQKTIKEAAMELVNRKHVFGENKATLFIAKQYSQMNNFDRKVAVKMFSLGLIDIFLLSDSGSAGTDFQSPRQSYMCQFRPEGKYGMIMQFKGRLNRIRSHDMCPDKFKRVEFQLLQFGRNVKVMGSETNVSDQNIRTKFLNYYRFLFIPTIKNEAFPDLRAMENHRDDVLVDDNFICLFCGELNLPEDKECSNCKRKRTEKDYYYFHVPTFEAKGTNVHRDINVQKKFQKRRNEIRLGELKLKSWSWDYYRKRQNTIVTIRDKDFLLVAPLKEAVNNNVAERRKDFTGERSKFKGITTKNVKGKDKEKDYGEWAYKRDDIINSTIEDNYNTDVWKENNSKPDNLRNMNDGVNNRQFLVTFFTRETMKMNKLGVRTREKYTFTTYNYYFDLLFVNEIKLKYCIMTVKKLQNEENEAKLKAKLKVIIQNLIHINGKSDEDRLNLINKLNAIFNKEELYERRKDVNNTFLNFLKWYPTTEPIERRRNDRRDNRSRRDDRRNNRSISMRDDRRNNRSISMRDGRDDRRDDRSDGRRGGRSRVINQPYSYDELFF